MVLSVASQYGDYFKDKIGSMWTAGHRKGSSNEFEWRVRNAITGGFTPFRMKYTRWSSGNPNNLANEDCINLLPYDRYRWNDVPCTNRMWFVCEDRNNE